MIGILEDSGYLSRAAVIADRTMSRVGLNGKSFIPLLSAYACAVPAIMATRTIENKRDRIATILHRAIHDMFGATAGVHHGDCGVPAQPPVAQRVPGDARGGDAGAVSTSASLMAVMTARY